MRLSLLANIDAQIYDKWFSGKYSGEQTGEIWRENFSKLNEISFADYVSHAPWQLHALEPRAKTIGALPEIIASTQVPSNLETLLEQGGERKQLARHVQAKLGCHGDPWNLSKSLWPDWCPSLRQPLRGGGRLEWRREAASLAVV